MLLEVAIDGGLKVNDRLEDAAPNTPSGESREEVLDGVEPEAGGWGEVEHPSRMTFELGADVGVFVRGVVVEDGVDDFPAGTSRSTAFRKRMNS